VHCAIALCTIVAHNTAQNRPDNFPSYFNFQDSDDVYLREGGISQDAASHISWLSETDGRRVTEHVCS